MEKAPLIQKVLVVSFLIILLGQCCQSIVRCHKALHCQQQWKCKEGVPSCDFRTNECFCRTKESNLPFTCRTVADCVRQLKCINGTPSCFAKTQACYCKLPWSRPNNETRCIDDTDCRVLLKCNPVAKESATCFLPSHGCYCKRPPPTGPPPKPH